MITASWQCRECSTATGYSSLRTDSINKKHPSDYEKRKQPRLEKKKLFWRLSGRGSISRSLSVIPGWIKR